MLTHTLLANQSNLELSNVVKAQIKVIVLTDILDCFKSCRFADHPFTIVLHYLTSVTDLFTIIL